MKKTMLILVMMLLPHNTEPQVGCMDNSKHLDTCDGCDYKTYHYVYCTCPCQRYARSYDRGRCEKCLHFRDGSIGEANYK